MTVPVLAQFGGTGRSGNFDMFGPIFGPRPQVERQADYSHAPAPRKLEPPPSGGNVLVLGDAMADWLAYGLEDALGDTPDLAVVRRHRTVSGLIRYDSRNENLDWAGTAREAIAATKPKFIVMMVGLNDRIDIRERVAAPAKGATPAQPAKGAAATTPTPAQPQPSTDAKPDAADAEAATSNEQAAPAPAPDPQSKTTVYRIHEFRSDEWAAQYTRRIDQTIAAMKSAGVPVFWVGLPAIRGPKSTSDMQYLDDLFRGRAEKAGINYIDVWDGFVDEGGRFTAQGPDFEGQIRRLRTADGVYFTKSGARKLAHYLEREISRQMAPGAEVVALPSSEPQAPSAPAKPSGPAQRPLAGPVVPLTAVLTSGPDLAGGKETAAETPKSVTRVLVNGEAQTPPAGRSDDFRWPRRGVAPFGTDPVVATTTEPIPVMKPAPETTVAAPTTETRPVAAAAGPAPRRTATVGANPGAAPGRPPQQQFRTPNFFSFFR